MNKVKKISLIAIVALVGFVGVAEARTLSIGSTGADVSALQSWLIEQGYPIPLIENGLARTGYFGEQTQTAVKIYQEDKGLATTGVIDSNGYSAVTSVPLVLGGAGATGPDFYGPYTSLNNVRTYAERKPLAVATTTICSIRSPLNATSTLVHASFRMTTGTTSASFVTFAKSSNGFSSTTALGRLGFAAEAASAQAYGVASTTQGANLGTTVFSPGQYLVITQEGATFAGGTYSPGGSCQGEFIEI